jgi:hypothetical protein
VTVIKLRRELKELQVIHILNKLAAIKLRRELKELQVINIYN